MKVLVCGSRTWTSQASVDRKLDDIHASTPISLIVEGEASGADLMGRNWAERRGVPFVGYRANWKLYGRAAGPIRNREQFDKERPNLVVAFHEDLDSSKGTRDMVRYARSKNCPVEIVKS